VLIGFIFFAESGPARIANIVGMIFAAGLTLMMWSLLWHQKLEWCLQHEPCVKCGAATIIETPEPRSQRCAACDVRINPGQWLQAHSPSLRVLLRYSGRAVLFGVTALVIGFGLILISPLVYSMLLGSGGAVRAVQTMGRLPRELVSTIDLVLYLLLFAVVARIYRGQLARFYDQAVRCMRCGHDLRGTPIINGVGTCGECGGAFVRATSPRRHGDTE
jgi:hypothetical protein